MRKQGAIILATGGDNSNGAEGNFYEGFMATGYASDVTDAPIQSNIVVVGYRASGSTNVGRALHNVGKKQFNSISNCSIEVINCKCAGRRW